MYWPDGRVGTRQRVCSKFECQRYWQRFVDREWHARHPEYDVERRLRGLRERLERSREPSDVVRQERPPLCRLPADEVREEFGTNGLAVLVILGRLVCAHSQEERMGQVGEIAGEFGN